MQLNKNLTDHSDH